MSIVTEKKILKNKHRSVDCKKDKFELRMYCLATCSY